jgi:hypothetical protein
MKPLSVEIKTKAGGLMSRSMTDDDACHSFIEPISSSGRHRATSK